MVLAELVRLFDSSTKSTFVYVFIVLLTDHRHLTVQYIFLYIWDIAATAESTSRRRFCALLEYVLHYPQGNERTGDIRGAFHSTKNSGLKFRVFHATNGTVFSGSLD